MKILITDELWDFVEKYLPGYYEREDVLKNSELQLFIDGLEYFSQGTTRLEAEHALSKLIYQFCFEAIDAYSKGNGIECSECESQSTNFCPHCGRKRY